MCWNILLKPVSTGVSQWDPAGLCLSVIQLDLKYIITCTVVVAHGNNYRFLLLPAPSYSALPGVEGHVSTSPANVSACEVTVWMVSECVEVDLLIITDGANQSGSLGLEPHCKASPVC